MLALSLVCGLCVGGSPDQAAFLAPHSSSLCQGPHLASFPYIFVAGTGPWHPHPHPQESGNIMLDWAGDMATSQGAEVTIPVAFCNAVAGNSHFLLLGLHFRKAFLSTRVPSSPPSPPPSQQGPLLLNHISVGIGASDSQFGPRPAVVCYFQIQVWTCHPGQARLLFWPHQKHPDFWVMSPSVLGSAVTPWAPQCVLAFICVCALLCCPHTRGLCFPSPKQSGRTQLSFCIQPSSAIPHLCSSSPPSLCVLPALAPTSVRAHGQCCEHC